MDHRPRSEGVRLAAAAAYLPFVSLVLLLLRQYRDVRLVRFHAYQALGLAGMLVMGLLIGSGLSQLLGELPGVGFLINLGVGVGFVMLLLGATALGFYGAYMGYQGNYTSIPILTDWVWLQVNGGLPPAQEPEEPTRRRRRRREPEPEPEPEE